MEISLEEFTDWSMSVADAEVFGKNGDEITFRLPTDLKAAMARKGAETGMSAAAAWRTAAMLYLHGPEHVGMLVAKRYGMVGASAPSVAPHLVPTSAQQAAN